MKRKVCLFRQENNRFRGWSKSGSQVETQFEEAPIGSPMCLNSKAPSLQLRKELAIAKKVEEIHSKNTTLPKINL
jgi:hypothetical protein